MLKKYFLWAHLFPFTVTLMPCHLLTYQKTYCVGCISLNRIFKNNQATNKDLEWVINEYCVSLQITRHVLFQNPALRPASAPIWHVGDHNVRAHAHLMTNTMPVSTREVQLYVKWVQHLPIGTRSRNAVTLELENATIRYGRCGLYSLMFKAVQWSNS